MSKFKLPKPRFDRKIANEGREFYIEDENGTYWGTFRIGLIDNTLPRYRLALEKLSNKYNNNPKGPLGKRIALDDNIAAELFVELALIDWKDVGDWHEDAKDGAMIPFTKANAVEFFTLHDIDEETGDKIYHTAWLLKRLSEESENIRNFQPAEQTEDAEGN